MSPMTVAQAVRYTDTVLKVYLKTRDSNPDVDPDVRVDEAANVLFAIMEANAVDLALVCAVLCDRLTEKFGMPGE